MRVGILIDRLNVGGVEKIAIEQVIALRKNGEDVTLVILRKRAVVPNAFTDLLKGVPIVYLDERLPRMMRLSFRFPVFSFFSSFHLIYPFLLPFVVKTKEYDYLISHGSYTSMSAVALKKFRKIPFSAFIWDPSSYILERVYTGSSLAPAMWALRKLAYNLDKFLINNMENVLVGGSAHNKFIRGVNPNKPIKTIYPSVHPIRKLLKKQDYIVMVTAWKAGKNPEYIFDILKGLPEVRIKMVGKWVDPSYLDTFKEKVKRSHYSEQVDIVGAVSEAELSGFYAKARILLQTNDDRGFGMPAMEAAGNGTTFIIPRGQGVCSLFVNKVDGFYTKELDTVAIRKLLKKMYMDEELAITMGARALEKVRDNYSWDKHAQKIKQLYTG